jgi:hypothetical protein
MARALRVAVCSGVVLRALIKLVCGEFLFFARGDGDGEYRPGYHAGGGADLRMNFGSAASKQDSKLAPSLSLTLHPTLTGGPPRNDYIALTLLPYNERHSIEWGAGFSSV